MKLSDAVMVWFSVWSEVQMICIWYIWCHQASLASLKYRMVVPYPGCPGKEDVKPV